MPRLPLLSILPLLFLTLLWAPLPAQAAPADDLTALSQNLDRATGLLTAGDLAGARQAYAAFDDGWFNIEDGIRAQSRTAYKAIEDGMDDVKFTLSAEPPDQAAALAALQQLRTRCDLFISGQL
jgi:high-affinity iron transporter